MKEKTASAAKHLVNTDEAIRAKALAYPETREDSPWGHRAFKVRGKSFAFTGIFEGVYSISVKLPESGLAALALPFASPTEYGLGKSGWVTARFAREDDPPLELLVLWLDESYRAIAPKKLVATLTPSAPAAPAKPAKPAKRANAPKPAKKRATASSTAPKKKATASRAPKKGARAR